MPSCGFCPLWVVCVVACAGKILDTTIDESPVHICGGLQTTPQCVQRKPQILQITRFFLEREERAEDEDDKQQLGLHQPHPLLDGHAILPLLLQALSAGST